MSYYLAEEAETNAKTSVAATPHHFPESPFGETIVATGPLAKDNPFRFSTKFTDDETALLYYGYRYYSPGMGRWLNRDLIGEAGSINLYLFCRNSPLRRFDPFGLTDYSCEETQKKIDELRNTYGKGFVDDLLTAIENHKPAGTFDLATSGDINTWQLSPGSEPIVDSDFGNYLAGVSAAIVLPPDLYVLVYNAGQVLGLADYSAGDKKELGLLFGDDWAIVKNITQGILDEKIKQLKDLAKKLDDLSKKPKSNNPCDKPCSVK